MKFIVYFFMEKNHNIYKKAVFTDTTEPENREEVLNNDKERFQTIINNMTDLVALTDIEGNFKYTGPSNKILGYSLNWLIGKNIMSFVHPDDLFDCQTDFSNFIKSENLKVKKIFRYRCRDGKYLWVETFATKIFHENQEIKEILFISRDITEQKLAEEKLRESEEQNRIIFEQAKDAILTLAPPSWKFTSANPAALKLFGIQSQNDITELTPWEISPKYQPDGRLSSEKARDAIAETIQKGACYFEWTQKRLNGDALPVSVLLSKMKQRGQIYIQATVRDISKQRETERSLKLLSKMQSLLMKIATDYINIPFEHINSAINHSLRELGEFVNADRVYVFDYDWPNDMCHNTYEWCREGVSAEIHNLQNIPNDFIRSWIEPHKQGQEIYIENVFDLDPQDGTRKILEPQGIKSLLSVPLMRENECIGFIGFDSVNDFHSYSEKEKNILKLFSQMLVNINKKKNLEENLIKSREEAEAASKAKSEFLANMSHEIRTPMNSVIGFSELLQDTSLNKIQKTYVDTILSSGESLLSIINDILDLSKIEAGKLDLDIVESDIIELAEQSADMIKYTAEQKNIELLVNIDPGLPKLAAVDPLRLRQVLTNLLSNAVKFTEQGEIELKVSLIKKIKNKNHGQIEFSVRDTGVGISKEQQKKLFKAFSQADTTTTRKFGGSGLGLIISQQLVQKMGGTINLKSDPGYGSRFYFTIETSLKESHEKHVEDIKDFKSCLVIDDNLNNRTILEHILKKWKIGCISCDGAEEAVKILEDGNVFDIVICDYHMPSIDGLETVQMIRERQKALYEKTPVILLHSSSDDTELQKKCQELKIFFRLTKPVKQKDLLKCFFNIQNRTHHKEFSYEKNKSQNTEQDTSNANNLQTDQSSYTILIAEDNPANMLLITTLIKNLIPNGNILKARDGKEAFLLISENRPDLIFMDIQMPEMDGNETVKALRQYEKKEGLPEIPVICLTAGVLKDQKEKSLKNGMNDYLSKPFQKNELQTILCKYLKSDSLTEKHDSPEHVFDTPDHFDKKNLLSDLDQDTAFLKKIFQTFLKNAYTIIGKVETYLSNGYFEMAENHIHSLKGSAGMTRCTLMAELCQKLENEIGSKNIQNALTLLKDIKNEQKILEAIFKKEFSENS